MARDYSKLALPHLEGDAVILSQHEALTAFAALHTLMQRLTPEDEKTFSEIYSAFVLRLSQDVLKREEPGEVAGCREGRPSRSDAERLPGAASATMARRRDRRAVAWFVLSAMILLPALMQLL